MDGTGQWLPLREAAQAWGISEKSVRRRVLGGTAQGRKVETPTGLRWEIWVPDADLAPTRDGARDGAPSPLRAPGDPGGMVEALALIERLHRENAELSARVGYLTAQLEQAQRALEAPRPTETAPESPRAAEAVPEPATRPRWRRWWGWAGAGSP